MTSQSRLQMSTSSSSVPQRPPFFPERRTNSFNAPSPLIFEDDEDAGYMADDENSSIFTGSTNPTERSWDINKDERCRFPSDVMCGERKWQGCSWWSMWEWMTDCFVWYESVDGEGEKGDSMLQGLESG